MHTNVPGNPGEHRTKLNTRTLQSTIHIHYHSLRKQERGERHERVIRERERERERERGGEREREREREARGARE